MSLEGSQFRQMADKSAAEAVQAAFHQPYTTGTSVFLSAEGWPKRVLLAVQPQLAQFS
jgi:hypothetical protein